jgi:hypothetical protein
MRRNLCTLIKDLKKRTEGRAATLESSMGLQSRRKVRLKKRMVA